MTHRCPRCADQFGVTELGALLVHLFTHTDERLDKMANDIEELTAADTANAAAQDAVAAAVASLASEQQGFLNDIRADLAGLGNNDQVAAIAAKVEARTIALGAIVQQVEQLQADQVAEDAADAPVVPPVVATPDDGTTPVADDPTAPVDDESAAIV